MSKVIDETTIIVIQNDVEMPVPKYFTHNRVKVLKEREKMLGQILAKLGPQEKDGVRNSIQKIYIFCHSHCMSYSSP